ncbi:TonB-dependent receptor [Sphingobium sp. H39-3-25]|uniref:TonB-dependent receptor plug domain-containing protein n=1 Tax=Sphingobium arseniciresistens TaxID=3030834 RepID=UPI0023B9960B|nr:TonB-dependent receptor [Sphingobium arseniciresistens]
MTSLGALAMALSVPGIACAQDEAPQAAGGESTDTIVVTGTRTVGFKASDSPAPIQVLGSDALKRVGQTDMVQALAQQLPSVQAQGFGSDQAAFHPSVKLRGLNPNHTLVLIDGKRRHGTSSVVVTGGPFGGNAAADISLIPQDAIDHVEVLQDGAAAQYGTDAIAGVLNFILKRKDHGGDINLTAGKFFDEGGQSWSVMGNFGFAPIENAFVNITAERKFKNYTFRGDLDPRVVDTGLNTSANTGANGGRTILRLWPGVASQDDYPYVNRISGDGRLQLTNIMYNSGWQVAPEVEIYASGSYSRKKGKTWQNYRLPNVVFGKMPRTGTAPATSAANSADVPFQQGFRPQELLVETDFAQTLGVRGEFGKTTWDLSSTYGLNKSEIYVIGSANAALYYDTSTTTTRGISPSETHNGDFIASQWTNTLDVTHEFDVGLAEPVTLAGGLEYRREVFQLKAGEVASYYTGSGVAQGGIQSFFGYAPSNASRNIRKNFSQYLDVSVKPVEAVLLDGAVRHEHYDDFGDTTVFKLTGRYDISPVIAIRGTASTGFRAPTLAEGFYSGINVSVSSLSGIFAPNSAGAAALGIAGLKPEKSTNFSGGFVLKPLSGLTITVDAYSIRIRDRIVRSSSFVGFSSAANTITSPSVIAALRANGVPVDSVIAAIQGGASGSVGVNAFVNGVTSLTQGLDVMATYTSDLGNWGSIDWSLAGNYNKTEIKKVNAPPSNIDQRVQLLDVYAQADLTKTTPKYRATASAFWSLDKFSVNLRESYYGSHYTIISTPTNGSARERLGIHPMFITDLELSYKPIDPVKLSIGANNLFNKYPTKYPKFIRDQQYAASSTAFVAQYPGFSAIGINGGYYYARATLSW